MKYSERATELATQQGAQSVGRAAGSASRQAEAAGKTEFGFWVYLMTDCILFASLFATFAVLRDSTFGGPTRPEIFSLSFVLLETMILLTSSFVAGLAVLAARAGQRTWALRWLLLAFLLGAAFVALEIHEFAKLASEDHGWRRSAFLSSFFTLVGTHGLHVTIGLIWAGGLGLTIWKKGLTSLSVKRLTLWAMFWHFLDIVWIFIFTIVYLMGVAGV